MTRINMKTATAIALGALFALGTFASPASARWYQNYDGYDNNRDWDNSYRDYNRGYYYRDPPVVYGTPYGYGYNPPPVIYGPQYNPGFSIRLF